MKRMLQGWMAAAGIIGISAAVWLVTSAGVGSLGVSLSSALEGSPAGPAEARPRCRDIRGANRGWRGIDLLVKPDAGTSTTVGSASLTASTSPDRSKLHWSSDLGIDAVLIHTGSKTRVERFDEERFSHRHALKDAVPTRVTFCYDLELTVNKDANASLTRVYNWDINKDVEPAQLQLTRGAEGTSTYKIEVNRDAGTERDWTVTGTISVDNLTPTDAIIESVVDVTDDGIAARVDCGVDLPGYVLKSGASLTCEYLTRLSDDANRSLTAKVHTRGAVLGAQATAAIRFEHAQIREVDKSVTVNDSSGRSWTFDNSETVVFEQVFRCDDDAGLHPSAVQIVDMDRRASTSVSVDCQPAPSETTASKPSTR